MSNFNKILFDLLIMVAMSQYSLSQILMAPMGEISEVTSPAGPVSYTASFFQYEEENRFLIYDPDPDTEKLSSKLGGDFPADAIEFCSYRGYEFEFFFRQSTGEVIRLKCSFVYKSLVWRFFNSLHKFQNKGAIHHIFKMVRYNNKTGELKSFARQVVLYAKDISEFTGGAVAKSYSISVSSGWSKLTEPILIFSSGTFAISTIHNDEKIALCLKQFPNERFLIAFSGPRPCQMLLQDYMQPRMRAQGLECKFPDITNEQELQFLNR